MEWSEARPGCAQCGLGITASPNADGTLSFNVATLDAALNSDFSGVLGFFQSANSWGQEFKTMLNNAGTSSTNGIVALAQKSNSSVEKNLAAVPHPA